MYSGSSLEGEARCGLQVRRLSHAGAKAEHIAHEYLCSSGLQCVGALIAAPDNSDRLHCPTGTVYDSARE